MRVGVIVQARMGSTRCPGKVLRELHGKPLLQYLLESLQHCQHPCAVVVATSRHAVDDAIVQFCRRVSVSCHRGSLENVASRFADILQAHAWDGFVRICGDSPLLDHRLVDLAVETAERSGADMVTNVFPRTFPSGQSVELLRAEPFLRGYSQFSAPDELEHVTPFFYRRNEQFQIVNVRADVDLSRTRMTVDVPEDLWRMASVLESLSRPHWQYTLNERLAAWQRVAENRVRLPA